MKDKNIIIKNKTNNNNENNKSKDNIKIKKIYNTEIHTNSIRCLNQNNKFYFINKIYSNDNTILIS